MTVPSADRPFGNEIVPRTSVVGGCACSVRDEASDAMAVRATTANSRRDAGLPEEDGAEDENRICRAYASPFHPVTENRRIDISGR